MILSSPILAGEDGVSGGAGSGSGGGGDYEFGIDPSVDPELAEVHCLHSGFPIILLPSNL